jgi:hypothetical protein
MLAPLLSTLASLIASNGMAYLHQDRPPKPKEVELGGYTAVQWAEWGKHKSKVATSTCRLNGELKVRISSLEDEISGLRNKQVQLSSDSTADPWQHYGPWSGSAKHETGTRANKARASLICHQWPA